MWLLAITAGGVLALLTVPIARRLGLANERVALCVLLALIGAIYPALLAARGAGHLQLVQELVAAATFAVLAFAAWRVHPSALVIGLTAHALWDFAHVSMPGSPVPHWYIALCLGYDATLGIYALARLGDWRVLQTH